jgi:glycosyltransferase involved in cell wall biosynthesis
MSSNKKSVVVIGPAYPLRGGLASFNERLTRQFQSRGYDAEICTFSLQYPDFLFPGTTQYSSEPKPGDIKIETRINSVNPFNWIRIGQALKKQKPDLIVVRYWMPFMAPCLGTILKIVRKNKHTKIVCIADNVIPHEKHFYDKICTQYFVKNIDAFITMSDKVLADLKLFTQKKATKVIHPLYDNFGEIVPKIEAQKYINIEPNKKTILFFGFIRAYKGLDLLIEAIKLLKDKEPTFYNEIQVVIAGEYYEDEKKYTDLIKQLGVEDALILKTKFISDSEVKYYLSCCDVVIQPYRNATQSGVTPLAYHFEKPMIVTNVGGLAANVPHEKVGLVCEPNPVSIAEAMVTFFNMEPDTLLKNIREEKKKYSWDELINAIEKL